MSLFNDNTEVQLDPTKDYTPELVGEGKKFKDIAALAFGKLNSDIHTKRLEKELQELREDLNKRVTLEEVLTKINQNKQATSADDNQTRAAPPAPGLSKEELDVLIAQTVSNKVKETETERAAKAAFEQVTKSLESDWGPGWQEKLEQKRQELGLGKEWMTQLAGSQPKAFLTLVGVNAQKSVGAVSPFDVSPGGINSAALGSTAHRGEKTASYYNKMRQTDPKRYHSKDIQMEIYNQAMKLGEAYFDA